MFVGKSYQNGHILIDAEGSLVVFSAKSQDDGLYGCEAVNTIGATMRDVRLNVRCKFLSSSREIFWLKFNLIKA